MHGIIIYYGLIMDPFKGPKIMEGIHHHPLNKYRQVSRTFFLSQQSNHVQTRIFSKKTNGNRKKKLKKRHPAGRARTTLSFISYPYSSVRTMLPNANAHIILFLLCCICVYKISIVLVSSIYHIRTENSK
jgi:hypothetical protein